MNELPIEDRRSPIADWHPKTENLKPKTLLRPMKHHLNTLFVMTQGAYLKKDGETIVVRVEKKDRLRLPMINVGAIVCMGPHAGRGLKRYLKRRERQFRRLSPRLQARIETETGCVLIGADRSALRTLPFACRSKQNGGVWRPVDMKRLFQELFGF